MRIKEEKTISRGQAHKAVRVLKASYPEFITGRTKPNCRVRALFAMKLSEAGWAYWEIGHILGGRGIPHVESSIRTARSLDWSKGLELDIYNCVKYAIGE